jgi:hypothetical protein
MTPDAGAPAPASTVYEAVIDLPDESGLAQAAHLVGRVLSTVIGDAEGMRGDVVVRHRDTEEEVLRIDAGADEETVAVLERVRADLDSLSAEEFVATWRGVDEDSHPDA